ncbi:MAG: hypothetical protein AAB391_01860 [Patescibacteria group bacterium]
MSRASAVFRSVTSEKEDRASIWFWPLLTAAFLVFAAAKLFLGFIGLFRKSPKRAP